VPEQDGRTRVIIEDVTPRVDDGAFPIKRIVGDTVTVEADVFTDGHDAISCALLYKKRVTQSGPRLPWSRWSMTAGRARSSPGVGMLPLHGERLGRPL